MSPWQGMGRDTEELCLPQELHEELTLVAQTLFPKDSQELRCHLTNHHFCVYLVH